MVQAAQHLGSGRTLQRDVAARDERGDNPNDQVKQAKMKRTSILKLWE
jgi:hypothetical protein